MKAVIKEQMQEISDLQKENEELKNMMEELAKRKAEEVAELTNAPLISINKEALKEDIEEAKQQIDDIRKRLEQKKREKEELQAKDVHDEIKLSNNEDLFAGMDSEQRMEAIETTRREVSSHTSSTASRTSSAQQAAHAHSLTHPSLLFLRVQAMVKRMKEIAENEQEAKNLNSELQQLEEIQEKLEAKLLGADKEQVCAMHTPTTTTTAAITALTHPLFIISLTVYAGEEGGGDKGGGGGEGGDQEEGVRGEDHGG